MNLFEVLASNDRIVVWSNDQSKVIYTWNKSLTLQRWTIMQRPSWDESGETDWEEVSIRTLANEPSYKGAIEAAKRWDNESPESDDR